MNYKLPSQPDWWLHSAAAWIDIANFFGKFEGVEEILTIASNWTLIPAGKSHTNYHLKLPKQQFFVQVYSQKSSQLQPAKSYMALYRTIAKFDAIQPWLVSCYFESNQVKFDQWFVNDGYHSLSASNASFIESLSEFLANLHQYNLSENYPKHKEQQLSIFEHSLNEYSLPTIDINEYIERYRHLALENSDQQTELIESLYQEAKALSNSFFADTFCHNDLGFNNILWSSDNKLKIIDWEYCGISDRYIELANLISECNMDRTQESDFLQTYSKKTNTIIDLEKLSRMKLLSSCINQLWFIATD